KPPESVMIGWGHALIVCSPPNACTVEEAGCCIKWKVFITSPATPHAWRSALSTARTTPTVASDRKVGRGSVPWGRVRLEGVVTGCQTGAERTGRAARSRDAAGPRWRCRPIGILLYP